MPEKTGKKIYLRTACYRRFVLLLWFSLVLTACQASTPTVDINLSGSTQGMAVIASFTPLPSATLPAPSATPAATTAPPPSNIPTIQPAALPSPTPTWIFSNTRKAVVPILMYQNITDLDDGRRYSITTQRFAEQLDLLKAAGYATITVEELAEVLWHGGYLPARPIILTFDDGNVSIYHKAYPMLAERGFRGVAYIVSQSVDTQGFLNPSQLQELIQAGWEIGSHSMTHADLANAPLGLKAEMYQSRVDLSTIIGQTVQTFAYPYIVIDPQILKKAEQYGYRAAVCPGSFNEQSIDVIFCLYRREISNSTTIDQFKRLVNYPESGK